MNKKPQGSKSSDARRGPHGGKNVSKSRHRGNRRARPGSEYDTPDTGGVIARSLNPRSVVLSFDEAEAEALILCLRASGLVDTLRYVDAKLAWTRRYNAKLKR
jgi:hypothetical protein